MSYDGDTCGTCGSVVGNRETHDNWHRGQVVPTATQRQAEAMTAAQKAMDADRRRRNTRGSIG